MKLLPSLKQKKRYIIFEIVSSEIFSFSDVKKEVETALLRFLGEFGVAKAAPLFVKEKYKKNKFMLKINHKYTDEVKSAVILIKTIKNKPVILKSMITSGTIKKASSYI